MNQYLQHMIQQAGTDVSGKWISMFAAQRLANLIVASVVVQLEDAKRCDPYTGELIACEGNTVLTDQIEWLEAYYGDAE